MKSSDGQFLTLEAKQPRIEKFLGYEDSNVRVVFEIIEGQVLFMHCKVYNWSRELYKEFIDIWATLLNQIEAVGFKDVFCAVQDEKIVKFANMFGFELLDGYILDSEQEIRRLMKFSLE